MSVLLPGGPSTPLHEGAANARNERLNKKIERSSGVVTVAAAVFFALGLGLLASAFNSYENNVTFGCAHGYPCDTSAASLEGRFCNVRFSQFLVMPDKYNFSLTNRAWRGLTGLGFMAFGGGVLLDRAVKQCILCCNSG